MSSVKFLQIVLFLITLRPIAAVHYSVTNHADKNPDNSKLRTEIGYNSAVKGFTSANEFVLWTFNLKPNDVKRYDEVRLTIESFKKYGLGRYPVSVASTIGNEVRINEDYLENFHGDVYEEFMGILFHETTHVWQWDGKGMAPKGLINGIADFVRLSAGWPSVGWIQHRGSGSRWDEGYAVTAYFLEYCSRLKFGFVGELNAMMKHYYSDDFFRHLLGKTVHELWEDYKAAYEGNNFLAELENLSHVRNEELKPEESVPIVSDSSEGHWQWQREPKGKYGVMQISPQDEVSMDIVHQNKIPTKEKAKFSAEPEKKTKRVEIVLTAEEQGTHGAPVHFTHIRSGFKDCLVAELNNMVEQIMDKLVPAFCNGPRKIGKGCSKNSKINLY